MARYRLGETITPDIEFLDVVTPDGAASLDRLSEKEWQLTLPSEGSALAVATHTTNYTMTGADDVVLVNNSAPVTITLPLAATLTDKAFRVTKTSVAAATVTLVGTSGQTIGGQSSVALATQNDTVAVISDGTSWFLIASGGVTAGSGSKVSPNDLALFVSTAGNDANDGLSWGSAFRSISAALASTTNPVSVYIGAGSYVETVTITREGTRLIAMARGDASSSRGVIVKAPSANADCIILSGANFCVIEGVATQGHTHDFTGNGIRMVNSGYNRITDWHHNANTVPDGTLGGNGLFASHGEGNLFVNTAFSQVGIALNLAEEFTCNVFERVVFSQCWQDIYFNGTYTAGGGATASCGACTFTGAKATSGLGPSAVHFENNQNGGGNTGNHVFINCDFDESGTTNAVTIDSGSGNNVFIRQSVAPNTTWNDNSGGQNYYLPAPIGGTVNIVGDWTPTSGGTGGGGSGGGGIPDTTVTWDPSVQQIADPDTIWIFDPTVEATIAPLAGGLIDTTGSFDGSATNTNPWRGGTPYAVTAGRFRQGIRGTSASALNYLTMPTAPIPSGQFTVEFWVRCDTAWSAIPANIILMSLGAFGLGGDINATISIGVGTDGTLTVWAITRIGSPTINSSITHAGFTAGAWVNIAVTYNGTTFTLYVNGSSVGTKTFGPPIAWSGGDRSDGLVLLAASSGASAWTMSDIRISRKARTPAVPMTSSATNRVTLGTTTGATVNQDLRGGLHAYAWNTQSDIGNPAVEAIAGNFVEVMRTDKFLSAVPIKTGGTDATHPTAGHSGSYSYNWAPVDHTIAYAVARFPKLYLGIDSCPQILGGGTAPFTAPQCADPTMLSMFGGFDNTVPNDFAAFATIASDLYYHVVTELGTTVDRWSFWNEPDEGTFWTGTSTQLFQLYGDVVTAIKGLDSGAVIGGPELADYANVSTWLHGFITYCGANSLPLDFVSYHHYTGQIGLPLRVKSDVASWAATAGITTPDLVVGEWGWQASNAPGTGIQPFHSLNMMVTGFSAAFQAAQLLAFQQTGIKTAIYLKNGNAELSDIAFDANGFYSHEGPWATQNVINMWQRLGASQVLPLTSSDLENGVYVQASKASNGNVFVLVVNHKWRLDRSTPITITLPSALGVTHLQSYWLIDSLHSDAADEAVDDGTLQAVTPPIVTGNYTVTLTMRPRSVHLLQFVP